MPVTTFAPERRATHGDGALALQVLAGHPHGMLVEDREGRLLARNRAAEEMLGAVSDGTPRLGCAIAGCQAGACLHDQARSSGISPAEVRIDLPGGGAACVTVAALGADRDLVLTQLRPAGGGEPTLALEPRLEIFVLGQTALRSAETPLGGRWLRNRAGHIMKFLVAERHRAVYSDELLERLWPNNHRPDSRGLRYFIHSLREQLEPAGPPVPPSSFVLATRGGYELHPTRVWIDATAFEELVTAGLAAHERRDFAVAVERLRRGLELYRGDFLADERYADWAQPERDRLRELASRGLRVLAAHGERTRDLEAAAASLGKLAELDPYDVDVHRGLLVLHLRRGRHSEALRCYQALRRRMLSTFGEELDFELSDLGQLSQARR